MRMRLRWAAVALGIVLTGSLAAHAGAADLDCLIEPKVVVSVAPAVEGLLETVTVDRGDFVGAGKVIATLESSVERSAVASARYRSEMEAPLKSNQIRVEYGDRRLIRTDQAYKEGGVPLKDVDEAETAKVLAEIGVLEAKENTKLYELELTTGKKVWEFVAGAGLSASPAAAAGVLVIGSFDGVLYCFG